MWSKTGGYKGMHLRSACFNQNVSYNISRCLNGADFFTRCKTTYYAVALRKIYSITSWFRLSDWVDLSVFNNLKVTLRETISVCEMVHLKLSGFLTYSCKLCFTFVSVCVENCEKYKGRLVSWFSSTGSPYITSFNLYLMIANDDKADR